MGTAVQVNRYGLHWAPGKIAFLEQGRNGSNAIGLRASSPFVVKPRRSWQCNHLIALNATNPPRNHLITFENLVLGNTLVRFMLPLPKADGEHGVGVISGVDTTHLILLLKMTSPVKIPIWWASLVSAKTIIDELEMTDVQPLVLAGVDLRHVRMAQELAQAARTMPRKFLIVRTDDVPIRSNLDAAHLLAQNEADLMALPWETLGAVVLRAYMRGEWDGTWFTREPIPGNEAKVP